MFGSSPFGRSFGFGDVFRQMEEEMADIERRMDRMLRSARASASEGPGTTKGPFVYGWTVEIGPEGEPRVRQFGNTDRTEALEDGWREPFVTSFFDEDKHVIRVTAELPGVSKDTIDVQAFEDGIQIEAVGEDRRYRTRLPVTKELDPDTADASYNNGILEVTVQLAETEPSTGKKVDIR